MNTVLVDGPNFTRVQYPIKRLTLTNICIKGMLRGARTSTVNKAWKAQNVDSNFDSKPFAKKLVKQNKRASLTDKERFEVMVNRKQRSAALRKLTGKSKAKAPVKKAAAAPAKGKGKGKK